MVTNGGESVVVAIARLALRHEIAGGVFASYAWYAGSGE